MLLKCSEFSGCEGLPFPTGLPGQTVLVNGIMYCTRYCLRNALRAAANVQRYVKNTPPGSSESEIAANAVPSEFLRRQGQTADDGCLRTSLTHAVA